MRRAFRLFLEAAKLGNVSAYVLLGQFYDCGSGVKFNENAALYWYRRAYRCGDHLAANNIGCIWRDRNSLELAIQWFRRAVRLGDGDANLNIAKVYLHRKRDEKAAMRYLKATCKARNVTVGSREEARQMMKDLRNRTYFPEPSPKRPPSKWRST